MALSLPLSFLILGAFIVWVTCSLPNLSVAGGVFALLLWIMFLGPTGVAIYGSYFWLKTGHWASISVYDVIAAMGPDASDLLQRSSWEGVQKIADWYLETSIGWTLLFLPMALIWLSTVVSEHAFQRRLAAKTGCGADKVGGEDQSSASS